MRPVGGIPMRPHLFFALIPLLLTHPVLGQNQPTVDQGAYSLFNPTPRDRLRPLSTDRPDKTESPYTVDAGHLQIEMDLVNFSQDTQDDIRTEAWSIAPVNIKVGLTHNADLQFLLEPVNIVRVNFLETGLGNETTTFGDLTTRVKINFWGNDGGSTAFGMMPFITFPTGPCTQSAPTNLSVSFNTVSAPPVTSSSCNRSIEGGLILPLAIDLGSGWGLGLMTEFDFIPNEDQVGYHTDFINSAVLGYDVDERLGVYFELFTVLSTEQDADWIATVDTGFTYALTEDLQLDAGINVGLTPAADDVQLFVGLSIRL